MEITISGKNKKLLKLVEDLAKALGLSIKKKTSELSEPTPENNGRILYELMEEKAKSGGIQEIKDPAKWQREIRKDKPLYGRE